MNRQGLYYSLRNQIHKDSANNRESLFRDYIQKSILRKFFYRISESLETHTFSIFLALIYGACSRLDFARAHEPNTLFLLSGKANERKAIQEFQNYLADFSLQWLTPTPDLQLTWPSFQHLKLCFRFYSVLRRVFRKQPFYIGLRFSRTLFFYCDFLRFIEIHRPKAIVFSTDGNPHGSAAMGACLTTNTPSVFVAHSPLVTKPGRLLATVAIFWGSHHSDSAVKQRSQIGQVLHYGFFERYQPMSQTQESLWNLRWGIFLSKDFSVSGIQNVVDFLQRHNPKIAIRLRPHPNKLSKLPRFANATLSEEPNLLADCKQVDIVLCSNSTVHLECLLHGIPSFFCPNLNSSREMLLPFIQNGLVETLELNSTFQEAAQNAIRRYNEVDFKERLSYYLNLQQSQQESFQKIRKSLLGLM